MPPLAIECLVENLEQKLDSLEQLATGGTQLRWDGTQFIYNWQSPKAIGCYKVIITLDGGTAITALFQTR